MDPGPLWLVSLAWCRICTELLEHGHDVQIMPGLTDFVVFEDGPHGRIYLDLSSGSGQGTIRCLQIAALGPRPHQLRYYRVTAFHHTASRAGSVGDGLLPPSQQLQVLVYALRSLPSPDFFIDNVGSVAGAEAFPITLVVSLEQTFVYP